MAELLRATVARFVKDSNRIEGIVGRCPFPAEIEAHRTLWARPVVTVPHLEEFVTTVAAAPLRDRKGMNVRVGAHVPPPGHPRLRPVLTTLLGEIDAGKLTPFEAHVAYEALHPFMDGNGRSGRALWAWHMLRDGLDPFALGFLHSYYYQSLDGARR